MAVEARVDRRRGCGWRKPGGLYLVSGGLSEPCPLLPVETRTCPTCGAGIRPARGWTWIDGAALVPPTVHGTEGHALACPLAPVYVTSPGGGAGGAWAPTDPPVSRLGRAGLLWIGEAHYPTAASFMAEAEEQGVSRRVTTVPRGFEAGRTWVLMGHRRACRRACPDCGDRAPDPGCRACGGAGEIDVPGIVTAFRPTAVEYVVKGDETAEEIAALEARGVTPVRVERAQ